MAALAGLLLTTLVASPMVHPQLAAADAGLVEETNAHCCYAQSDKYWVTDPAGVAWETYHTLGSIPMFGGGASVTGGCDMVSGASVQAIASVS